MAAGAIANPFEDQTPQQQAAPSGQAAANPFEDSAAASNTTVPTGEGPGFWRTLYNDLTASFTKQKPGESIRDVVAGGVMGDRGAKAVAEQTQKDVQNGNMAGMYGHLTAQEIPAVIGAVSAGGKTAASVADAAGEAKNLAAQTFSKTAVTNRMGTQLSSALDRVAADAGLPNSTESSLSGKTADIVHGLKKQAQTIYGQLDQASGGRYQRFVDEIDDLNDALRNKYTSPKDAAAIKKQLTQVQSDYAQVQQQLVAQGVDPKLISAADSKWAQAKALEQVGKKFRVGETLSGDLKPGTPSIDTGLKNLKPHILPQAAKAEAPGITDAVTSATKATRAVTRNRKVAGAAAALAGAGAAAKYGGLFGH